ncbi:adaptor protein MecA [Alicyclobacillus tolerans]|uniref:adaptor protein MecA n=1 Tax=Alicyclobacillus tolerans TaxID=90970 RepID=UPI001F20D388|nr:adaptor protein MecA [Alicyclobacillus tolerans]MCF8563713.1 adaptor protein MecA [Alicyclobacillus tolerans]
MRVERIAKDKVRIFVSYDDLDERGIDRDEIWQNGKKVQELFWDMMETAYTEVGFEIAGPIAVEAFTMPTEGVVVIVTRVPSLPGQSKPDDEETDMDLDTEFSSFVFRFQDFEDVVRAAHALEEYSLDGALYEYQGDYYLFFDEDQLKDEYYDSIWSILHEYGDYANVTVPVLEEYGRSIMPHAAIELLVEHFPL